LKLAVLKAALWVALRVEQKVFLLAVLKAPWKVEQKADWMGL
jgi:hypothetical protein